MKGVTSGDRGYKVSLDLHQGMVRLRATLPPKPSEPSASPWKQRRISIGLCFPDQASETVTQAEKLGAAIERGLRMQQPFDWSPWERPSRGSKRTPVGAKPAISVQMFCSGQRRILSRETVRVKP